MTSQKVKRFLSAVLIAAWTVVLCGHFQMRHEHIGEWFMVFGATKCAVAHIGYVTQDDHDSKVDKGFHLAGLFLFAVGLAWRYVIGA